MKFDHENLIKLHENKLLQDIEIKKEIISQDKSQEVKYFNQNFAVLRRARIVVEALNKTNKNLEEKLHKLESEKEKNFSSHPSSAEMFNPNSQKFLDNKVKGLETQIFNLSKILCKIKYRKEKQRV